MAFTKRHLTSYAMLQCAQISATSTSSLNPLSAPVLSLLIPCFNNRDGLLRILGPITLLGRDERSLLEVIISDDSYEPLLTICDVQYYTRLLQSFKYIHNQKRLGAVHNWNYLLEMSNGKYTWLCHHDEYMYNGHLAISYIITFLSRGTADIIILPLAKSYCFGPLLIMQPHTPPAFIMHRMLAYPSAIFTCNPIGPPSALILRRLSSFAFDSNLTWYVDVEYYSRVVSQESTNITLMPAICQIISDQNFDGTITSSLRHIMKRVKKHEVDYLRQKVAISTHKSHTWYFIGLRVFLILLRTARSRLFLYRNTSKNG